jgi:hypothetical protein
VPHPGAGAQPLHGARRQVVAVAGGVLVGQRATQDPGDDLDVAVAVRGVARAGVEVLVVAHQQRPESGAGRVEMGTEGEAVSGPDAVGPAGETVAGAQHPHA